MQNFIKTSENPIKIHEFNRKKSNTMKITTIIN